MGVGDNRPARLVEHAEEHEEHRAGGDCPPLGGERGETRHQAIADQGHREERVERDEDRDPVPRPDLGEADEADDPFQSARDAEQHGDHRERREAQEE